MSKTHNSVNLVLIELAWAEKEYPDWPDNVFEQLAIIGEELGEAQQAALDARFDREYDEKIRKEVIQVAAMALRFLNNYDR